MNRFPSLMPFQGWLLFVTQLKRRRENKSIWEDDKKEGEKKANTANPLKQFVWSNFTPMAAGSTPTQLWFILFPLHMIVSHARLSLSSAAPRPSITKQLLEELHVKCIRSNMARHTVLLSHYTACCSDYFIHGAVRLFSFEKCCRITQSYSFINMPLSTPYSTGLKKTNKHIPLVK